MSGRANRTESSPRQAASDVHGGPGASRLITELVGTFALTTVAAGGDVAAKLTGGQVTDAARAVAPALLVMAFIYAVGDGSGAHFNPAVSLGFALKRLFPARWLLQYWAAQLAGATLAGVGLRLVFGDVEAAGVSTPHVAIGAAVVIEALLTWLLLTVILGTADRFQVVGSDAALAVGGTIALCGLIALPLTGASMNPARSFGPAAAALDFTNLWIYVAGPAAGACLAVALTRFIHGSTEENPKSAEAAQGST